METMSVEKIKINYTNLQGGEAVSLNHGFAWTSEVQAAFSILDTCSFMKYTVITFQSGDKVLNANPISALIPTRLVTSSRHQLVYEVDLVKFSAAMIVLVCNSKIQTH